MPPVTAVHTADAVANLMLFAAAAGGHTAAARLVLLLSHSAATTRQGGQLPVHVAACGCHTECLRALLEAWPATALSTDGQGRLPLHRAAAASQGGERRHHGEAVRLLLAAAPQTVTATTAQVSEPVAGRRCSACFRMQISGKHLHSFTACCLTRTQNNMCTAHQHAATTNPSLIAVPSPYSQDELALHLAAAASRWSKSSDAVQALLNAAPQPGGAAAAAAATDGHGRVALVGRLGEAVMKAAGGHALGALEHTCRAAVAAHMQRCEPSSPLPAALCSGRWSPAHTRAAAASGARLSGG